MFRLAAMLYSIIGTSFAGSFVIAALSSGYDTLGPIIIAAAVFSPSPTPAAIPQASAMTFLHAPPISVPTTSALVEGRR